MAHLPPSRVSVSRRFRPVFTLLGTTLFGTLVTTIPVLAQRPLSPAAIDSIVRTMLASTKTPGAGVAVVQNGDTLVLAGYGLADVENNVPVTRETVFRIGSITKQFTAAAIMRLVEVGKVRLDEPITSYLPTYPATTGRTITIRHLLTHTSGIPDFTSMGPAFWGEKARLDLTHEQMLALFKDRPLDFTPGSRWNYSNSGYYLLGLVIERVSGKSYSDYLRDTFFSPLGLTNTRYCGERTIIPHRAQGYAIEKGVLLNDIQNSIMPPFAAGALCSTTSDLLRWSTALASGQAVTLASYAQMTTPVTLSGATGSLSAPYGFGLVLNDFHGHQQIAHSGGIHGFTSYMASYPSDDVKIVVLCNNESVDPALTSQAIARKVLHLSPPVVKNLPLNTAERARYVGAYDILVDTIRIVDEHGTLQMTGPGTLVLRYQGNQTFAAVTVTGMDSGLRLVFRRENAQVVGVALITAEGIELQGAKGPLK